MEVLSIVETEHCKGRGGKGIVGDGTARRGEHDRRERSDPRRITVQRKD
jgi:hypothetical protein